MLLLNNRDRIHFSSFESSIEVPLFNRASSGYFLVMAVLWQVCRSIELVRVSCIDPMKQAVHACAGFI
jgi:hypothetical protein